jgi:cytochrome P450
MYENVLASVAADQPSGDLELLLRDPVAFLLPYYRAYDSQVAFVKGRSDYVLAFGPEHNRELLSRPDLYYSPGFVHPGPKNSPQRRLYSGLVSLNGAAHKRQRRVLLPPFQKVALDAYRDKMASTAAAVLDRWRAGCVRDVSQDALELIYHVTGNVLYGLDADEVRELDEALEPWLDLNGQMMIASDQAASGDAKSYQDLQSRAADLEHRFHSLIERRRAAPALGNDFLSLLVRIKRENPAAMSDAEMLGHLAQFFSVSFHSTRDVLIWALFLLAQHPDAAADLLDELTATLHGDAPTAEQLNNLPYLDHVVKETMRLFPPLVYYSRVNRAPVELGGMKLKPGTNIVFSHYYTHRLPELYPAPNRFRPERWATAPAVPYALLPFGSGPRMCLGAAYSVMAVKLTLAMIWQRFRLTVVPGAQVNRRVMITLFPRDGVPMWVHRQDRNFSASPVRGDVQEMVDLTAIGWGRAAA